MVDIQKPGLSDPITGDESADTFIVTTDVIIDLILDEQAWDETITSIRVHQVKTRLL